MKRLALLILLAAGIAFSQTCTGVPDPRIWAGTYSGSATYTLCNVVYYSGSAYVSIVRGSNIGHTPAVPSAYWTLLYSSPVFLQASNTILGSQIALDYNFAYLLAATPGAVPYTGASADVDLGAHSLKVQTLTLSPNFTMSAGTGSTSGNFFLGSGGQSNTTGTYNSAAGFDSMLSNTTGEYNTAAGSYTLYTNAAGSYNTAVGDQALFWSNSDRNTAVGAQALFNDTTGESNTATGSSALTANTIGADNTADGMEALRSNSTGGDNTAVGSGAMGSNSTGNDNTAVGSNALNTNSTGNDNTAVGYYALSPQTGNGGTAVGSQALTLNTGDFNTASGFQALTANTTGFANLAAGYQALSTNTTGEFNTAVGNLAGAHITGASSPNHTGLYNLFAGYGAMAQANGDNNEIVIGANATGKGSNTAVIGTAYTKTFLGAIATFNACANAASPAVCAAAPSGFVVVATGGATVQVNTTAVTANSQILLTEDSSLGSALSVTCNTNSLPPMVTARSAGVSFTITVPSAPSVNPECISYTIVN